MRRRGKSESDFALGRTIAGASHRSYTMSRERKKQQQRQKRKTAALVFLMLVVGAAIIAVIVGIVTEIEIRHENELAELERQAVTPTVEVVDENAGEGASRRTNEFIVRLETASKEYDLVIDHVVLPFQKARQIIVFFEGREEYYRLSIDRGVAVQMEDAVRMINYLDEQRIRCSYVDLRVEGRAYYK